MVLKQTGLAAAVLLASSQLAYANDLNINGFINVTGGVLSTDKISLDGYDDNPSFDQGTLMGLQMLKKVNDSTSATVFYGQTATAAAPVNPVRSAYCHTGRPGAER